MSFTTRTTTTQTNSETNNPPPQSTQSEKVTTFLDFFGEDFNLFDEEPSRSDQSAVNSTSTAQTPTPTITANTNAPPLVQRGADGFIVTPSPELMAAFRQDIRQPGTQLSQAEGNVAANAIGVTAKVFQAPEQANTSGGPIIITDGGQYGDQNAQPSGTILHTGGNHFVVIEPTDAENAQYQHGGQYYKQGAIKTRIDGSCLLDALHIVDSGAPIENETIQELRTEIADNAEEADLEAIVQEMIQALLTNGQVPQGLGETSQLLMFTDPSLGEALHGLAHGETEEADFPFGSGSEPEEPEQPATSKEKQDGKPESDELTTIHLNPNEDEEEKKPPSELQPATTSAAPKKKKASQINSTTMAKRKGEAVGLATTDGMAGNYFKFVSGDFEPNPDHEELAEQYDARVGLMQNRKEFRKYKEEDLKRLTAVGAAIGLDKKTLADMLFIGSRGAKFRTAEQLIAQMVNLRFDMPQRGCPYRFKDPEHLAAFSNDLIGQLKDANLSCDNVNILGSSLRSAHAKDIDVCIMVDKPAFADLVKGKFKAENKSVKLNGEVIDISGFTYDQLLALANEAETVKGYNADAKILGTLMRTGLIRAEWLGDRVLRNVQDQIIKDYPDLNIEHICYGLIGGPFHLSPSMTLKLT